MMNIKSVKTLMFGLVAQANFGEGLKPPSQNNVFAPAVGYVQNSDLPLFYLNRGLSAIITILTSLGGLIFLIQFFQGSISWISAGGDQKKISDARDRITHGVIGLVVIVVAYSVIGVISTILGIEILNPAAFLRQVFNIPRT